MNIDRFCEDGFLVVRGAVAPDVVQDCVAVLRDELRLRGIDPANPRTWTKPVVRVNCPEAPAFAAAGTSSALAAVYDALLGPDQWIRRAGVGGRTPRACAVRRTRCGVQRSRSSGHDVRTTPNLRDRYCRGRLRLPSIHRPSCNLAPSWDQTTDDRAARNRTPRVDQVDARLESCAQPFCHPLRKPPAG